MDVPEPRVDRTAFSVCSSFEEAQAEDDRYWQSRTPAERMIAMEQIRRVLYGDAARGRMKKVFEVVERDW